LLKKPKFVFCSPSADYLGERTILTFCCHILVICIWFIMKYLQCHSDTVEKLTCSNIFCIKKIEWYTDILVSAEWSTTTIYHCTALKHTTSYTKYFQKRNGVYLEKNLPGCDMASCCCSNFFTHWGFHLLHNMYNKHFFLLKPQTIRHPSCIRHTPGTTDL
jgi:hypothetical protein